MGFEPRVLRRAEAGYRERQFAGNRQLLPAQAFDLGHIDARAS